MPTVPRDNNADIELFYRDPNAFLLAYQDTLRSVLKVYIRSGLFRPEELNDTQQTLNEELIRRIPTIRANFNGKAALRTYLSAIIRNICLDLSRLKGRHPPAVHLEGATPTPYEEMMQRTEIEHARRVFRAILKQFDYKLELPRLLFCLKLRYRITIEQGDVLQWYPGCSDGDLKTLLRALSENYVSRTDKEIYELLTPLLNKADGRENTPEAIRKWTKWRIDSILELLNGSPPTASFDEETLKILLEDFFSPFLLQIQ